MIHHVYFSENILDKFFRLAMLCMKFTVKTFFKYIVGDFAHRLAFVTPVEKLASHFFF